ncbi:MAG TPA: hypothetical protein VEQ11_00595 [Chloroflexota bacterium]|nr:hypothetical protein [Chloroflexota bacterium]
MSGATITGQQGNGEDDRLALAAQVERHTQRLEELARHIGPDCDPSSKLLASLGKVGDLVEAVSVLVDEVRERIGLGKPDGTELAYLLDAFSGSIQTASDAIQDFRNTLVHELDQRAVEKELYQHRPNKRFREDQQELRTLSRGVEGKLADLRGHMDVTADFSWPAESL